MEEVNRSVVSEFISLGLCDSWELQAFFLVIFPSLYFITMFGNVFVVAMIITDLHLHSPMYVLLANLSLIDFCLSSATVPKMITDFPQGKQDYLLQRMYVSDFLWTVLWRV